MSEFKSGFVSIVGRPNVGKSTLLNRIIGQKIAIISSKPQTTRNNILGVWNRDNMQIVFVDTPGIHKPFTKLGETMMKSADNAMRDADVVLFLVEPDMTPGKTEEKIKLETMDSHAFLYAGWCRMRHPDCKICRFFCGKWKNLWTRTDDDGWIVSCNVSFHPASYYHS